MADNQLNDLNVDEVLELVNSGEVSVEDALTHEKNDKNRATLISKLESMTPAPTENEQESGSDTQEGTEEVEDKVKLLKNIKYKGERYKVGQEIEVTAKDKKSFADAGIIEI